MKKATLEMVQNKLGDFIKSSVENPTLILRDGEPVAMLVGLVPNKMRTPAKLRDILQHAWQDYEEHGGIPHEQFWEDLAKEQSPQKKKRGTR